MNQNPFLYRKYQARESVANENTNEKERQQLINNYAGLVQFLNSVFVSVDLHNDEVYDKQAYSMNGVLTYVWNYSHLLQDKSPVGFGRWCSGKDIDFIHATVKRKKVDEAATISVRSLYVLKKKYIANVVKFIAEQLPLYQQTIPSFKNDGYSVIGYARKSRSKETNETRTKLLNLMCKKLKMRSMVEKVFVSYKTNTNDPIMDRDIDDDKKALEEIDADGNTQDMLKYVL
ncbi:hypothetical protein G6F43_010335 [Rhizopus delemar]|nr:hypothetical protein G6F43_010335 [Rhizopus delemar]